MVRCLAYYAGFIAVACALTNPTWVAWTLGITIVLGYITSLHTTENIMRCCDDVCYVCRDPCDVHSICPCGAPLHLRCHMAMLEYGNGYACGVCRQPMYCNVRRTLYAVYTLPRIAALVFIAAVFGTRPDIAFSSIVVASTAWMMFGAFEQGHKAAAFVADQWDKYRNTSPCSSAKETKVLWHHARDKQAHRSRMHGQPTNETIY